MTLLEAIEARHSVRKYTDGTIPEEVLATLRNKVWEINKEAGLHVQLVTDEPRAFGGFKSTSGVFSYGAFSNVKNYLIMAGKKGDDLDEKVGYWGEQLVLLAQTLVENPHQTDPLIPRVVDPRYSFLSSHIETQAVGL